MKVAVVDNDADLVNLMRELLEARGLESLSAGTMRDARRIIWDEHPGLVLLDLWLETPTSGWDLMQEMKADPVTRDIPVVVVTGGAHLLGDGAARIREHGARLLAKPFDLDEFDRMVDETMLGGH